MKKIILAGLFLLLSTVAFTAVTTNAFFYLADTDAECPTTGQGSLCFSKQSNKVLYSNGTTWEEQQVPASASWGNITGILANQSDLNTALSGKAASSHNHDSSYSGISHNHSLNALTEKNFSSLADKPTTISGYGITDAKGYCINVQALTSSPADGATVYFGAMPKAPTTTAAASKLYIRKAGTIKVAEIYCYSGTAGTNENWSLYIRVNNTTDYLIATLGVATNERVFSNTGLNISVNAGDYIEIKGVQPTWATNPLTTVYGGYIYIE